MAVEAGAKNGIIEADKTALEYLEGRTQTPFLTFSSDKDAVYDAEYRYDVTRLQPVVAQPYSPANIAPACEINGVKLDQVVIGSCTNGRISDLRAAARILRGKKAAPGVRLLVFPATQQIYLQAVKEGLIEIFIEAGAMISPPVCGPCLGGHLGLLAEGEVAISTTNRNFASRMGHKNSKVYLSSPYTAAASAVAGYIIDPRQVI
jgi:3-isopropylmalate/(R)-2-methylmalate dehydratase large subunit